jgi:hypothetical protein
MGDASEKKIKPLVPLPQQPASEAPKGERLEVASKGKEPVVSTNQYKPDATSNKPVRKETHVVARSYVSCFDLSFRLCVFR